MKKSYLYAASILLVTSLLPLSAEPTSYSVDIGGKSTVNVSVIEHTAKPSVKLQFNVRLQDRLDESKLKKVFDFLRNTDKGSYENIFFKVFVDQEVYALCNYTDNVKITMMGSTQEQYDVLKSLPKLEGKEKLFGAWLDRTTPKRIHVLERADGYFAVFTWNSRSISGESESKVVFSKDKKEFTLENEVGTYSIDKNGDLEYTVDDKKLYLATKIPKK